MTLEEKIREFKAAVELLAHPDDFKDNHDKLSEIRIGNQETFLGCLKMGGRIIPSIKATEMVVKISWEKGIAPMDCLRMSGAFRLINELLDMQPD